MSRYETRTSPVTGYIWVTWDKLVDWFIYGSMSQEDTDAYTERMNAADIGPPAEEAK